MVTYLSDGRVWWQRYRKIKTKMHGYDWRGRRLKVNMRNRDMA